MEMLVCVRDHVWMKRNDGQIPPRPGYFRSEPARPRPGELGKRRSWAPVEWHAASEGGNSHSSAMHICTATSSKQRQLDLSYVEARYCFQSRVY